MAPKRLPTRHLVLRNLRQNAILDAVPPDPNDPQLPNPGDMQLYSFYEPALQAGTYTISVTQQVEVPDGPFPGGTFPIDGPGDNPGPQQFEVVAPQFVIDPKDIHSVYPPEGHADQPMILPHIVLNDPHLPWEQPMSGVRDDEQLMPWLAVLPFDCNALGAEQELRLTPDQLNGNTAVYKDPNNLPVTQSSYFSLTMALKDYFLLGSNQQSTKVYIPPFSTKDKDFSEIQNLTTPVDVIFLSGKLFKGLFGSKTDSTKLDISQYQYCSHVRNINTAGMTDSGVEDTGLFSVIHSLRTGPTDIAQNVAPRSQVVHLISLQYVDQTQIPNDGDLVALISLYSWTYLCQPPLTVNFVDDMRAIGDQVKAETSLLRYPDSTIAELSQTGTSDPFKAVADAVRAAKVRACMIERFNAGYCLVRHRTATGEATVAFTRSPLVPVIVPRSSNWPYLSNNGQDYQILDSRLGIMDISYSSAWQLGRTLASSDLGFVASLMRVRGDVHRAGVATGDSAVASLILGESTKKDVLGNLMSTVNSMHQMSDASTAGPNLKNRWSQATKTLSQPQQSKIRDVDNPIWMSGFKQGVQNRLNILTSAQGTDQPYNELTSPVSTDWAFVHNWILDKLFFDSIPTQYLITDPAHLPPESIRFFHIDPVWMDCLVDGALSVANHLSKDDDNIRQFMKVSFNNYLKTPIVTKNSSNLPQVPTYGFFLRSAVVKTFPDLRIDVPFPDSTTRAPVLLQKQLGPDILFCLLDRLPDGGEMTHVRISQPPHQQCFSAGDFLDQNSVEFMFRKVYLSAGNHTDMLYEFGGTHTFLKSNPAGNVYNWDTRCLDFSVFAHELFFSANGDGLSVELPTEWPAEKCKLTSAMAGLQLNDTVKYLEILPSKNKVPPPPRTTTPRLIYVEQTATSSEHLTKRATTTQKKMSTSPSSQHERLPIVTQRLPNPLPQAPHTKSLQLSGPSPPIPIPKSLDAGSGPGPGAKISQFKYAIYPSTTPYSETYIANPFVNTSTPFAPDLIFSANLITAKAIPGLMLNEIAFRIPIGDPSLRKDKVRDIIGGVGLVPINSSPGSEPRMLSNQRWVVHQDIQGALTNPKAPVYLNLRIIARTVAESVPILENQSLSFKLGNVEIAGPDGKSAGSGKEQVIMIVTERFGNWKDAAKTKWNDQGSATTQMTLSRLNAAPA